MPISPFRRRVIRFVFLTVALLALALVSGTTGIQLQDTPPLGQGLMALATAAWLTDILLWSLHDYGPDRIYGLLFALGVSFSWTEIIVTSVLRHAPKVQHWVDPAAIAIALAITVTCRSVLYMRERRHRAPDDNTR